MKQLSNYSLQYYNDGRFPIPQTIIVIIVAFVKLLTTVLRDGGKCPISKHGLCWATVRTSFRFLVPAILYGINNNIYFFGLTLVAPPIWLILCSFRTIITASTYKVLMITFKFQLYLTSITHDISSIYHSCSLFFSFFLTVRFHVDNFLGASLL